MTKEVACTLNAQSLKGRLRDLEKLKADLIEFKEKKAELKLFFTAKVAERVKHFAKLEAQCCAFALFETTNDQKQTILTIKSSRLGLLAIKSQLAQIGIMPEMKAKKIKKVSLQGLLALAIFELLYCLPVKAALVAAAGLFSFIEW